MKKKRWSVGDFAKRINTNRNNVYDIFKRTSIDTELLLNISIILEHDFFSYYVSELEKKTSQQTDLVPIKQNNKWITTQFENINSKLDSLLKKR